MPGELTSLQLDHGGDGGNLSSAIQVEFIALRVRFYAMLFATKRHIRSKLRFDTTIRSFDYEFVTMERD